MRRTFMVLLFLKSEGEEGGEGEGGVARVRCWVFGLIEDEEGFCWGSDLFIMLFVDYMFKTFHDLMFEATIGFDMNVILI